MSRIRIPGSFRDPSGFLFWQDGELYRQVNKVYGESYDHLVNSGLYEALVQAGLLIVHKEVDIENPDPALGYKVIKPEKIPFISYPYEWCFSQLKEAALTTLKIQKLALDYGMSLKDCSAYNIQFHKGRAVFIDTLSFEIYREGRPWVAYRQFCQHFLAPLALMSRRDVRLNQLFRIYIDGLPLDLASSLLPMRTHFSFSLLSHLHLHAKSQVRYADKAVNTHSYKLSRTGFIGIISSLESAVVNLKWQPQGTEWAEYYQDTNYSPAGFEHKKQLVAELLGRTNLGVVWDMGANVGTFSRIASDSGRQTISFDIDPAAVEKNYLESVARGETNILPLLIDLTNPSPGIGWQNRERMSIEERGPADTAIALALIHHLAISNNVPLARIAEYLSKICNSLIIEFVPKSDSQVQRLLSTREDVFQDYTQASFEREFITYFDIEKNIKILDSERTLYLMYRKKDIRW